VGNVPLFWGVGEWAKSGQPLFSGQSYTISWGIVGKEWAKCWSKINEISLIIYLRILVVVLGYLYQTITSGINQQRRF
jgi:hypothetical protein